MCFNGTKLKFEAHHFGNYLNSSNLFQILPPTQCWNKPIKSNLAFKGLKIDVIDLKPDCSF